MSDVFADTFYYLAILNQRDAAHSRSVAMTRSIHGRFVTTAYVLTELADGLSTTRSRNLVSSFLKRLEQDRSVQIVPADQIWFDRGLELYDARADKTWSLTDCISFVVMRDHGLTDALTADHHFEQAGFVALLK